MSHFLRSIFIIFLSLAAFIANSMAEQTSSTNAVNGCTNPIIDVRPNYPGVSSEQSFNIDLHSYRSSNKSEVIAGRISLELLFSLGEGSAQEPIQAVGVGESSNFNGYFATPPLLFRGMIPIGGQSVLDVMRAAIRNGYEALGRYFLSEQQRLGRVTQQIRVNDAVLISLGQSHYVEKGDIFHIYSERGNSDSCNIVKDDEAYIATGTVGDAGDNISMLNIRESTGIVQVGDIVEFDPSIDLVSRGQEENRPQLNVLQMGRVSQTFVHFVSHRYREMNDLRNRRRTTTRDMTFYIEYYLVEEAPNFGFQVLQ